MAGRSSPFAIERLGFRPAQLRAGPRNALREADARTFALAVGVATFVFGFFVPVVLNAYLLAVHHPLVEQFRSTLTYVSGILGDGILLPFVNMTAAGFIARQRARLGNWIFVVGALMGVGVTAYFHVDQAVHGVVNWAMPAPWHWNVLGLWHAGYMLSVATLLSIFVLASVQVTRRERRWQPEATIVLIGLAVFFVLLRLDYLALDIRLLFPLA